VAYKEQTSAPSAGADELAVYAAEDAGGNLRLYCRDASGGVTALA